MLTIKQVAMDLAARIPSGQKARRQIELENVKNNAPETSDVAAHSDATVNDYGFFDLRPMQPDETLVKIPLGASGLVQVFYNPATKICRPIPEISV